MAKKTLASVRTLWLENKVKEQEAEIARLRERIAFLRAGLKAIRDIEEGHG